MNKQYAVVDGKKVNKKIEWTDYTWNPVRGCQHACRWEMPDGSIAQCYAESVALGIARTAYPQGFENHYWNPNQLNAPLSVKTPSRIFLDSMSDLMGHWVPDEQIEQVLDVARRAHWHTFQLLTKNSPRLLQFKFPPNVWVGVSAPPTFFKGRKLTHQQQRMMLVTALKVLHDVKAEVRWISFEPLSFDVSDMVRDTRRHLEWAVIGAATNGNRVYQPDPQHVRNLLSVLDDHETRVFFKGNLKGNPAAELWREEFPTVNPPVQLSLLGDAQ
jgi:protein gp37